MPKEKKKRGHYNREWALYHGDDFIGIGTRKELAKLIGVGDRVIHFYASPIYRSRFKDDAHGYVLVALDEEEI